MTTTRPGIRACPGEDCPCPIATVQPDGSVYCPRCRAFYREIHGEWLGVRIRRPVVHPVLTDGERRQVLRRLEAAIVSGRVTRQDPLFRLYKALLRGMTEGEG